MESILARRIKDLRINAGKNQEDLAEFLHIERAAISQYESGKRTPDAEKISKIADFFGVTTDYLLGRTLKAYSDTTYPVSSHTNPIVRENNSPLYNNSSENLKAAITIGSRVKECREQKGLTQQQLGELINVSDATINRYERDLREPGIETIKLLSKVLDCSTDYLLGLSDHTRPESLKYTDEIELDFRIAASNEDGYGREPSPELKRFVQDIIKEELDRVKKK